MALIIKDRIKEVTTTTGTGAITLGGTSATFEAFSSYMTNGDTAYYAIVHTASGVDEWEVGLGTWNTGNTFTRTTVIAGTNDGSQVNFSAGFKDIFMTYPASIAAYTDGSGDLSGDIGLGNHSTTELVEGSNLYYTDARVDAHLSGGTGVTYSSGAISIGQDVATTADVTFNSIDTTNGVTVGGDATIEGNLTVNGTTTTVNAENLSIADNLIYLNDGSTITNPDLGWSGNYNDGTYAHAGVFRDATDGIFKFFDGYVPEPDDVGIDPAHASYTDADIKFGTGYGDVTGDLTGNVTGNVTGNTAGTHTGAVVGNVTGDVTGNADTATALETSRTIQLTGDVIGSAAFDGTANAVISATVQDDSHAHVISNVDGLQSALDGKTTTGRTITAGGGLTGGGDLTANRTISHADTSTQASLTALTGAAVVSDVDVDTYGHVTNLATRNLTLGDLGYTGETNATADQTITAGSGLTGGGTGNVTLSHSDTSSQASVNNSGRTYIQDITLDAFGHITGISSATETVVNTDTNTNQLTTFQVEDGDGTEVTISHGKEWKFTEAGGIDINWTDTDPGSDADPYDLSFSISTSITAGNGLTGGGALSSNQTLNVGAGSGITVQADTVSHADTSSQASVNGSGRTYIQDVTLDGFGHVTGLSTATETVTDTTYSAGSGLSLSGTTFSHTDTSSQGSVNNSGATVIQDVTLDTYGHVTGLASKALSYTDVGAQVAGTYNTIIGTDSDLNTSGSTIIDNIYVTDGVITSMGTRTLTLADLGYTGATNANYITNNNQLTNGAGYTTYTANQALNTNSNPTFNDIYVADQIIHSGDTNTYTQFHAGDQWRVVVGGSERLEVKNSSPHVLVSGDLNSTSDVRLKDNIAPIENALLDVCKLEGVSFNWKDTGTKATGFIAQQVEPILPDLVNTSEDDGIKSVNYIGLIGHLVEAIKEQQVQIEELKEAIKQR